MGKGKLYTIPFKVVASVHLVYITPGTVIQHACQSSSPTACDFKPWTGFTEAAGAQCSTEAHSSEGEQVHLCECWLSAYFLPLLLKGHLWSPRTSQQIVRVTQLLLFIVLSKEWNETFLWLLWSQYPLSQSHLTFGGVGSCE